MEQQYEREYGIISYLNDQPGFSGIIKQRFSDFQVNEVNSTGEVVHLTNVTVIPPPGYTEMKNLLKPPEISDEEFEILRMLSEQEKNNDKTKPSTPKLTTSDNSETKIDVEVKDLAISVKDVPKEKRQTMHHFIHSHFPNLNNSTKNINGEKFIYVTRNENVPKQDRRSSWPKPLRHVHFVLYKENIDTIDAVNILAGKLRFKSGKLFYAGTKDRRAKTSQLISAFQVPPQNIASAAEKLKKVRVGNFHYTNKPQKLGQLSGNLFRIVLRDVKASDETTDITTRSLRENGFINYFGLQRFSSTCVSTHTIGRAMLKGNWQEAIDLILCPRENDSPDLVKAKNIWKEKRNSFLALKCLKSPRKNSIDCQLFYSLRGNGSKNLLNALCKLPRNVKLMYLHAYQSYIWNFVVSKRIATYKLKVLPGDLVWKRKRPQNSQGSSIEEDTQIEDESEDLMEECDNLEDSAEETGVRHLTEEEANLVSLTDVIMPLPGHRIVYPNNEIKSWYLEYLQEDGLTFDSFTNKIREFSLGGSYRNVIVRPQSFQCTTCYYNDSTKTLIQSDLEALNKEDVSANRLSAGAHKALILEFILPPSTYATMALRELMKVDTSPKHQTTLSNPERKTGENIPLENTEAVKNGSEPLQDHLSKASIEVTVVNNKRKLGEDEDLEVIKAQTTPSSPPKKLEENLQLEENAEAVKNGSESLQDHLGDESISSKRKLDEDEELKVIKARREDKEERSMEVTNSV